MKKKSMKHKISYILTILVVALLAFLNGNITERGLIWFEELNLPSFTPSGQFINMAWTIVLMLGAIAVILFLRRNKAEKELRFTPITIFLILNAVLNLLWSFLFFSQHWILFSVIEVCVLNLVNLILIILLWQENKLASIFFVPYFLWAAFITFFSYSIYLLN